MNLADYLETPEKYIPYGYYCYNEDGNCPFWDSKPGEFPNQEDGYCHLLEKSDWELNEEAQHTTHIVYSVDKELEGKTIAEIDDDNYIDPVSGLKTHFPMSLIWDQCKECGINMQELDEENLVRTEMEFSDNTKSIIDLITKVKK